jgi:hypothetical protein
LIRRLREISDQGIRVLEHGSILSPPAGVTGKPAHLGAAA